MTAPTTPHSQVAASSAAVVNLFGDRDSALGAPGRVLVVDHESKARAELVRFLRTEGCEVRVAHSGRSALALLEDFEPDVVFSELDMPGVDGLELVERGHRVLPRAAFVLMTAHSSVGTAVAAMKKGAENYLEKPLDLDQVSAIVCRARGQAQLSTDARVVREDVATRGTFERILGDHPLMLELLERVVRVAKSRATVLIHGESGTGKELIASAIHHSSDRKHKPFVRLNCASLAESLLESELFGHERGSFTGAVGRRDGRFAEADGGTLFLDEVSEIPISAQVKLLRFLQEREFERVGGSETIRVDVRIVAATNRDLAAQVRGGAFREDLFFRLNVVPLELPPLRARRSDIPVLAGAFLARFAAQNGRELRGLTPDALRHLLAYRWPGNVRELEHVIERAVVMSTGEFIRGDDLALGENARRAVGDLDALVPGISLAEVERLVILKTLAATAGSTGSASEILGISRRKIQYRLKEWGITAQDWDAGLRDACLQAKRSQ